MKIVIGGDHAGFELKHALTPFLEELGHDVFDVGTHGPDEVDFPDVTEELCKHVVTGDRERGIIVCGTGVGAAIAANKVPGVRAAVCHDPFSAHQSVEHDNANVMALGAWIVGRKLAEELVSGFLLAEFIARPEFSRRVAKLEQMDRKGRSA